ncbi:MAG: alpha-L-rhamnosidase [Clostridiales bacterium]|nr:alpha-L-rhamnosidase [Clostridiales bacterium]
MSVLNKEMFWIWYPGDFELYHAMRQNFSRVERGMGWPAFWKSEGFRNRVVFRRIYELKAETSFTVLSDAVGYVLVEQRMSRTDIANGSDNALSALEAEWSNHVSSDSAAERSDNISPDPGADWSEKKYPLGWRITCGPGTVRISIHAARIDAFPSVYIEGTEIFSDAGWMAEDYDHAPVPSGYCKYFTEHKQDPTVWNYMEKEYLPVRVEEVNGGVLCEFETELTAQIAVEFDGAEKHSETCDGMANPESELLCDGTRYNPSERKALKLTGRAATVQMLRVYCGESRSEALDEEHCYYSWIPDADTGRCPRCAVRYAYIPEYTKDAVHVKAIHQYVDIPVKASFFCNDKLLNRIWNTAAHTFQLCSGIFFIDGIKRDKWIWSGDAYQSILVNQYLLADPDIDRRTLLALRGNDPMTTHINTIVDYSLFWILGVRAHCEAYGDVDFLRSIYPKMESLMEFCEGQLDEHGFLVGREQDWVYIDWADMDKEGPVCAMQMLFAACYDAMAWAAEVLATDANETGNTKENADGINSIVNAAMVIPECVYRHSADAYRERYQSLLCAIDRFYWDELKGAYIDSFISGKSHVTRHANIFAIRYGIADQERQEKIVSCVLQNDRIPAITTPYFKFYELDVLASLGYLDTVMGEIRSYWGGMLERGAVTFWEEYDPAVTGEAQYDMYGDRFGKSLCHAWAASPIYLLARYFVGLDVAGVAGSGKEQCISHPQKKYFKRLDCTLPVGENDSVCICI